MASALAGLLKDAKLAPALVPGVNNRFLDSLAKGVIENFGSHFQGRTLWRRLDRRREGTLGGVQDFPQPIRLQEVQPDDVPTGLHFQKAGMRA